MVLPEPARAAQFDDLPNILLDNGRNTSPDLLEIPGDFSLRLRSSKTWSWYLNHLSPKHVSRNYRGSGGPDVEVMI